MNERACFRCGWCGQPVDKDGYVLPGEAANALDVDWDMAESVPGDCCRNEVEQGIAQRMRDLNNEPT